MGSHAASSARSTLPASTSGNTLKRGETARPAALRQDQGVREQAVADRAAHAVAARIALVRFEDGAIAQAFRRPVAIKDLLAALVEETADNGDP